MSHSLSLLFPQIALLHFLLVLGTTPSFRSNCPPHSYLKANLIFLFLHLDSAFLQHAPMPKPFLCLKRDTLKVLTFFFNVVKHAYFSLMASEFSVLFKVSFTPRLCKYFFLTKGRKIKVKRQRTNWGNICNLYDSLRVSVHIKLNFFSIHRIFIFM